MGSSNSTPVKNNHKFTLKTEAKLVSESAIGTKEIKKAYEYLTSTTFKKRLVADLNGNFTGKLKVIIDSLNIQQNLRIEIKGTIKVLHKESEEERLVKDGLLTALPHSSAAGEPMPPRQKFEIRFRSEDTSLVF